jgi:hypothetical protein
MSESPESRADRLKATLPESEQERFEDLKRLIYVLRPNLAIRYQPFLEQPVAVAARLEKVAHALDIPLKVLVWDAEVVFFVRSETEVDASFPLRYNKGRFETMTGDEAEAMQDLGSGERELFWKLQRLVLARGRSSYKCEPGEKPERVEELLRRVESTIEGCSLQISIKGREVFFPEEDDLLSEDPQREDR